MRFVPSGLGAHAVARKIVSKTQVAQPVLLLQRLSGGAVLTLDLSDPGQAQVYLLRRYEPDVVRLIARQLSPGGVFVDVGANIGLVTFSVGVRRPDISILAFEPDPANAASWRRNHALNGRVRAVLEQVAVGADVGHAELVQSEESGWSFIASSGAEGGVKVPMTTLDAYAQAREISGIDALKIDVEGFEPMVLQGAISLLEARAIRLIVCELDESLLDRNGYSRRDVISLLSGFGYSPHPVPPVAGQRLRRRSVDTSRDLLFVPEIAAAATKFDRPQLPVDPRMGWATAK